MADIGEIICDAVDTIIGKRLEGLSYDVTKICTIVNDENRINGEYTVSDNGGKYKAYSQITTYRKGSSVYVKIPMGDYTQKKLIEGLCSNKSYQPFNYVSPLNTMTIIDENLFNLNDQEFSLLANYNLADKQEGAQIIPIDLNRSDRELNQTYTRLGVKANFKVPLNSLNTVSGEYGIVFLLEADGEIYQLYLNSNDMYGNPYAFEGYFSQEKVFDISSFGEINNIQAFLYQNGNFKDSQDINIPFKTNDNELLNNNIFVQGIEIYFGYEENKFLDDMLSLYNKNSLNYDVEDNENKDIKLEWLVQKVKNKFSFVTEEDISNGKYEIKWYRKNNLSGNLKEAWEEIESNKNKFTYTFKPFGDRENDQIKAIGFYLDNKVDLIDENQENIKIGQEKQIESNILIYKNISEQIQRSSNGLGIYFNDGSNGNYYLYDQNGKLNDPSQSETEKMLSFRYNGIKIEDFDKNEIIIEDINWLVPEDIISNESIRKNKSMIISKEKYNSNFDKTYTSIINGITYRNYQYSKEQNSPDFNPVFRYTIRPNYDFNLDNNNIILRAKINGIKCEVVEKLMFGKSGSNGTDYTLYLDFVDNNGLLVNDIEDMNCIVTANLIDKDGNSIFLEENNIAWSWKNPNSEKYLSFSENSSAITKEIVWADGANKQEAVENNFNILQCEYKYDGYDLITYLPIAIKDNNNCKFIEGVKEVVYNHNGVPSFYSDPYRLFYDNSFKKNVIWELKYDIELTENLLYLPKLTQNYRFIPSSFYIDDFSDISIICKDNEGNILWSQPILIRQNNYDLDLLNKWNGQLDINDSNGVIMSSMLGAGRKNDDNTFSGVLIGDVKKGTGKDDYDIQTGIYGIDSGVISYELKEDGTATFGRTGAGQIKIDGKESTIKSGSWDLKENPYGMKIDLDDGTIHIRDIINNEDKKEFLSIQDTNGNNLISISNGEYYLQSIDGNTKLDLTNGCLESISSAGHIKISSQDDDLLLLELLDGVTPNTIMRMGSNQNYLQSKDYNGKEKQETVIVDNIVYNIYQYVGENGFCYSYEVDLKDSGEVTGDDSYLNRYEGSTQIEKETINFINGQRPYIAVNQNNDIHYFNYNNKTIGDKLIFSDALIFDSNNKCAGLTTAEARIKTFIAGLKPIVQVGQHQGIKLDLDNGIIDGYNLYLRGVSDNGSFTLDSTALISPFQLKDKDGKPTFSIDWDGTLNCNKVQSLNNDGRDQYAISIGNNFYVTENGSAGGGTWGGGCSGSSAYAPRAGKNHQITSSTGQTISLFGP